VTAAPVLTPAFKCKVTVSNGRNQGQSFIFEKPSVTVGRGPENDLVFGQDQRMSRNHFEIIQREGRLMVRNISQKNYLLVDNEKSEEAWVLPSTFIQAGDTVLQVQYEKSEPVEDENRTVAISAPDEGILQMIAQPVVQQASPPPSRAPVSSSSKSRPVAPYSTPPPAPPHLSSQPRSKSAPRAVASSSSNSRVQFYVVIAIIGAALYWVMNDNSAGKKPEVNIRTEGDVSRAIQESALAVQEIQKKQSSSGQDSVQYKAAQEHYIRGFRDYRQGQYARSMQSFQAALSFYPNHELARKYYGQAQRKFEAQIDFAMSQGRKNYQKNNFKMCQSSFASVMIMLKDSSKPKYKEAKQFYDECALRSEGRF